MALSKPLVGASLKDWQVDFGKSDPCQSFFDFLPNELLAMLFEYLTPMAIASFASANQKAREVLKNSPRLLAKMKIQLAFVRAVRVNSVQRSLRQTTAFLTFLNSNRVNRVQYLLQVAPRIPTGKPLGQNRHLILVVASSQAEAEVIYSALLEAHYNVYVAYGFISREKWQVFHQLRAKFFLIVLNIPADFEMPFLAAVVSFKDPRDENDYLEGHSLNPRRHYQIFTATADNYDVWRDIFFRLLPYASEKPSLELDTPLELNRSFFQARSRIGAGVVAKVFS